MSAHVAQLVEHFLGKGEVTGSNPVAGSMKSECCESYTMAKNRIIVHLECGGCGLRNYSKRVSKKRDFGKLALNKYCAKCRKHSAHKETK